MAIIAIAALLMIAIITSAVQAKSDGNPTYGFTVVFGLRKVGTTR